jgi:hypothetical protein
MGADAPVTGWVLHWTVLEANVFPLLPICTEVAARAEVPAAAMVSDAATPPSTMFLCSMRKFLEEC